MTCWTTKTNPDVLILLGPFVDIANNKISNGGVKLGEDQDPMELSFKDLFKMQVVQKIDLFLESTQILTLWCLQSE